MIADKERKLGVSALWPRNLYFALYPIVRMHLILILTKKKPKKMRNGGFNINYQLESFCKDCRCCHRRRVNNRIKWQKVERPNSIHPLQGPEIIFILIFKKNCSYLYLVLHSKSSHLQPPSCHFGKLKILKGTKNVWVEEKMCR